MVEFFVTHEKTLKQLYLLIFPQTTHIRRDYEKLLLGKKSFKESAAAKRRKSVGDVADSSEFITDTAQYEELINAEVNELLIAP